MAYQDAWNEDDQYQYQPLKTNADTYMQRGGVTGQQNVSADSLQQQQQQQTPQYATQQTGQQDQQPSQAGQNPFRAGMSAEEVRNALNQFAQSRGYGPVSDSAYNTWQGYYNQYGSQDPNYLYMRLQDTGEFGGKDTYGNSSYNSRTGVANMGTALGGQWGDRANSLYDMLMQRAQQGLNVDRNNPVIRSQADAYSAMQQRASRNYLGDIAERAGPNANISAERRSAAEKVGQSTSAFEAQLMGQEVAARRQEIAQALAQMGGFMTDQQRMALQEELSQLQLAQQAYQFDQQQQYAYSPFGGGY